MSTLTTQQENLYRKYVNCIIPRCQDTSMQYNSGIFNFDDGQNLETKINQTKENLISVLPKYNKPVILTSMQKDSIVVLDIVKKVKPETEAYLFYYTLPKEFKEFQVDFEKIKNQALSKNVNVIDLNTDERDDWIKWLITKNYDLFMGGFYPAETTLEYKEIMLERGQYYFSTKYNQYFFDVIHHFSVKNVIDYIEKYIPDFINVVRPMKCVF